MNPWAKSKNRVGQVSIIATAAVLASVFLLASGLRTSTVVFAQASDGAPTQENPPLTNASVDDPMLLQLVKALLAIQPMLEEANSQLETVDSDDEQWAIQQEFNQNAATVVEAQGLTVEQYRQLMALANNDTAFRQRVARKLDEIGGP